MLLSCCGSCGNCHGSVAKMLALSDLSTTTWTLTQWNQKRLLASTNIWNSSMPMLALSFITSLSASEVKILNLLLYVGDIFVVIILLLSQTAGFVSAH